MRRRVLLLLAVLLGMAPTRASADWREFIPRPYENAVYLDTYTSYERDHFDGGTNAQRWEDTFLREKLTLVSNGYSYHPRFIQYHFSIGGALRQEDYRTSYGNDRGWRTGEGLEYDTRLFFLPEHSYNGTFFASRYEPLFKEQAATQHSNVAETYGGSVRYRKKPYFVHAGFIDNHVDSGDSSSDVQRLTMNGEYFNRFVGGNEISFTGAVNPSWFSNSEGLDGDSIEYLAGNLVNLQWVRLSSSVTQQSWHQEGNLGDQYDSDQFAWYELLNAYLPWNFRSDLSYRYQDNDSESKYPFGGLDRDLSDTTKDLRFNLIHRLYQSLDSRYSLFHNDRTSSGGDTTSLTHSLGFDYTKVIPWGRFLAGTSLSRTDTDNTGQAAVVEEPYVGIPVPGSFTLRQLNVDPTTIVIYLKSPLPPFELIRLVENVDYTVVPVLNTYEIRVFTLPPEYVVPGTYDFLASYELAGGDFELRTDSYGNYERLELFNQLLTPYFSYVAVRSDVLSGDFPGEPVDSTTYTAGVIVLYGPWRARGEYQKLEWDVSPYDAWRAELQYVGSVNPTVTVYATTTYQNKHYGKGTSAYYGNESAYTEQYVSGSGSVQKRLPLQNMYLSVGGSYTYLDGQVITNAYSGNTALTWRVGKVDLSLGATAYGSDTSGGNFVSTERDHQLVYLKLRRRLY